ncbi:MAG: serine/threonine protein kinase [Myxococcales bacterium]|nr:serine/threonine protein kinase [Myxococcales bacterium]
MQAPQTLESLIGRVLDERYRIEEMIGVGGCGAVFRGRSIKLPKPVAIKVLLPDGDFARKDAQNRVRRFAQEARATSSLRHPNTIQVFDYGTTDEGLMYLVMEFLDGSTLRAVRQALTTLPIDRTCHIAAQICDSLAEAHENGIIHRDLKPDNVFLCNVHGDPDFVKVLDFGIAKMLESDSDHDDLAPQTKTGLISGTPRYMSPEQAMGEPSDGRSDLYSLGIILFEALTGRPPFTAATPIALLHKHLTELPPAVGNGCPPELDALVAELLEKNPVHRPANATVVAQRLRRIRTLYVTSGLITGEYESTASSSNLTRIMVDPAMISNQSSLEVVAPPRSVNWRGLGLAAAVVGVISAGVAWMLLKPQPHQPDTLAKLVDDSASNPSTTPSPGVESPNEVTQYKGRTATTNDLTLLANRNGETANNVVSALPQSADVLAGAQAAKTEPNRGTTGGSEADAGQMQPPSNVVASDVKLENTDTKLPEDHENKPADPTENDQPRQLAVSSDPVGAEVIANGISICETPCTLPIRDLTEPMHVEVRKRGYTSMVYPLGASGHMSIEAAIETGLVAVLNQKATDKTAGGKKQGIPKNNPRKNSQSGTTPSKYDDPW